MISMSLPSGVSFPAASRHPLLHPLGVDALENFCHPRCEVFSRVVRHSSGAVMAANGCVALRVSRGPVMFDEGLPAACADFLARVDALPWGRFANDAMRIAPPVWRGLDAVRGDLYARELEELWKDGRMTLAKPVWVGGAVLVPLAVLQLIARLPRVELRMDGAMDFLLIRFAGGEGIVANRWRKTRGADIPAHVLSLFTPDVPCLPGGLVC